jgi:nucleoside-diphosphate-sugar epimerase
VKVAVTGGTGFVGAHTVAELLKASHTVHLLVRSKSRIRSALQPLGVDAPDWVEGDVTDPPSVEKALAGCDAVIHAASVYAMHPRLESIIRAKNVRGTDTVLGVATRLGLNPIVPVSSIVSFFGRHGAVLGPESEPGTPWGAYFRSKADSERVARSYQAQGAPVVISYPCAVWGLNDPYFGESNILLKAILQGKAAIFVRGTYWISDVSDVARLHVRLLGKRQHDRYFAPTTTMDLQDFFSTIRELTGRRIPSLALPEAALRPPLLLTEAATRWLRLPLFWSAAGGWALGSSYRVDDSRTREEFRLQPVPVRDTIADNIRWLTRAGHVSPEQAGRLGTS